MNFLERRFKVNPEEEPVMTAFITATRRKVDNTWLNASREIRAYLCDQTLEEVSVEIADPELFRPRHIFPVLKTDAVFPIWDTVRDTILNEINLVDVQMVGCYRLGKSVNLHDNPPTVLVLVSTKSNRTWKDTREVIVNILHRFNLPTVAVEICKDEIRRSGGTAGQIDRTILRGPAKLGQGLGIAWKEKASGTFGGFIELKSPTTGLWRTFGITSLHWLIPEKKDVHISRAARKCHLTGVFCKILMRLTFAAIGIRDWHQNGVKMLDKAAEEHLVLYHPSLDDMDAQLQHIDQVIKRISNNPFYKGALELEKQGLSNTQSRRDRHNFKAFKDQLQEHDEFANEISVNSALKAVIDLVSLLLHQASNKSRPSLSKMPHFSPIWTGLLSRLMPVEKEPTM